MKICNIFALWKLPTFSALQEALPTKHLQGQVCLGWNIFKTQNTFITAIWPCLSISTSPVRLVSKIRMYSVAKDFLVEAHIIVLTSITLLKVSFSSSSFALLDAESTNLVVSSSQNRRLSQIDRLHWLALSRMRPDFGTSGISPDGPITFLQRKPNSEKVVASVAMVRTRFY